MKYLLSIIFYITWSTCLNLNKSVSIIRSRTGLFCITVEPRIVMPHMINYCKNISQALLDITMLCQLHHEEGQGRWFIDCSSCLFHKTRRHARINTYREPPEPRLLEKRKHWSEEIRANACSNLSCLVVNSISSIRSWRLKDCIKLKRHTSLVLVCREAIYYVVVPCQQSTRV